MSISDSPVSAEERHSRHLEWLSTAQGRSLDERRLQAVVSDEARHCARVDGRDPLEHALGDGEDFELLLAVEGDGTVPGVTVYPLGSITSSELKIRRVDGRIEALEPKGYLH